MNPDLAQLMAVYADSLAALSVSELDHEQVAILASRADALVARLAGQIPDGGDIAAWREAERLRGAVLALVQEQHAALAHHEAAEQQRHQRVQVYSAAPDADADPHFLDTRS